MGSQNCFFERKIVFRLNKLRVYGIRVLCHLAKSLSLGDLCAVKRFNGIPPSKMDNVIVTRELQVERKHFYIEFRENERGRFMRITEEAHGRRNTIIIPSTGLDEFMSMAGEVMHSADHVPAAS